jgi:hypothetical protein
MALKRKCEIVGRAHEPGEEERAYDAECGSVGLLDTTLPGLRHEDYRVLVMKETLKHSSNPTTKDFALAKIAVDQALKERGIGIIIPAAKPVRRTV